MRAYLDDRYIMAKSLNEGIKSNNSQDQATEEMGKICFEAFLCQKITYTGHS